ncbi:hypothetical protein BDN71DRAFT_1510611 [Pleurotus eryngii]|uniref:Uncharacterized protein n=1 Tax=Pleurotus eryngii TaxID=5323 RepID=A0A9P5ZR19_PLEER|nr:hypothetical protein BDN71DRAFT_1510611 [Pleurotus eryngii]
MKSGARVPECFAKAILEATEEEKLAGSKDISILCSAFMVGLDRCQAKVIIQLSSALIPAYLKLQAQAHAELDRVVGRDGLPTIEDEQNLPESGACITHSGLGLPASKSNPSIQRQHSMMDRLKKFEEDSLKQDQADEDDNDREGSDDDEKKELSNRFRGVDLDSTLLDDLWTLLTPSQQWKFLRAL